MARDPRQTYLHLMNLARDQAGTPEGETAAKLAEELKHKYGPGVAVAQDEPVYKQRVPFNSENERILAVEIGAYLGIESMKYGESRADGKGVRWLSIVSYEGPRDLVLIAVKLYQEYRRKLAEVLALTARGYAAAAFPVPQTERPEGAPRNYTAAQLAAIRGGMSAGNLDRHRAPVPEGRRLTSTTPKLEG